MIKILLIEDDRDLAHLLLDFLPKFAITIKWYENPELGLSDMRVNTYDMVLLDLTLPNMDGLEVCREIRATCEIPIIITSSREDIEDKSAGFYLGADDYLVKPYDTKELLLRIHSVLKRYKKSESSKSDEKQQKAALFDFDLNKREVRKAGKSIELTNVEFELLVYLLEAEENVVSREQMVDDIDALSERKSFKSLDVLIGRIRKKIEENPKKPQYLHTVRGVGYKLLNPLH